MIEPAPITNTVISKSKPKKKRSRKKKSKSTRDIPDDDSATYIDPLKAKETSLLKKVVDHDDDSQVQATSGGHVKRKAVTQVNIPAPDEVSIASTLTMDLWQRTLCNQIRWIRCPPTPLLALRLLHSNQFPIQLTSSQCLNLV